MQNEQELVSIVISTYNRSNVLRYTLETVLLQTYQHWELIVVGDCCTDDTKEVVESFGHDKIKFVNLEKNIGEQSGPNNYGVSISNGAYIAFLNHDDLWLPNHLDLLYQQLKQGNYDLVYSPHYSVPPDDKLIPIKLRPNNQHDNSYFTPASTWLFKKQLYAEIGPWEFYKKHNNAPSQVWLLKASKSKKIGIVNEVTVITVHSGSRVNSYKNRDFLENKQFFEAIKSNPDKMLKEIYYTQLLWMKRRDSKNSYHFRAIIRNLILHLLKLFGLTLGQLIIFLKNPLKGSYIDHLRKVRGLPKIK